MMIIVITTQSSIYKVTASYFSHNSWAGLREGLSQGHLSWLLWLRGEYQTLQSLGTFCTASDFINSVKDKGLVGCLKQYFLNIVCCSTSTELLRGTESTAMFQDDKEQGLFYHPLFFCGNQNRVCKTIWKSHDHVLHLFSFIVRIASS